MFARPRYSSLTLTSFRFASYHLAALLAVLLGETLDAYSSSLRSVAVGCSRTLLTSRIGVMFVAVDLASA